MRTTAGDRTAVSCASQMLGRVLRRCVYTAAAAFGLWLLTALLHTSSASATPVPAAPTAPHPAAAKSVDGPVADATHAVGTVVRKVAGNPEVERLSVVRPNAQHTDRSSAPARGTSFRHPVRAIRDDVAPAVEKVVRPVVGEVVRPILRRTAATVRTHLRDLTHTSTAGLQDVLHHALPPLHRVAALTPATTGATIAAPPARPDMAPSAEFLRTLSSEAWSPAPAARVTGVPVHDSRHPLAASGAAPARRLPGRPVPVPIPTPLPAGGGGESSVPAAGDQPVDLSGCTATGPAAAALGWNVPAVHIIIVDQAEPPIAPD